MELVAGLIAAQRRGGESRLNLAASDIVPVRLVSGPPALPVLPVAPTARRRPTKP